MATTPGLFRTWLLDHEKLLIFILGFALIWFVSGKIQSVIADHDNKTLAAAKVVSDQQAAQNLALAQTVAADKAQLQALSDKLQAQNAQLMQANVALASALTKQQHVDASLPLPELANRWAQLTPGVNFDGAATAGGNVVVTPSNALATVQQLEKVPVLTTQLANETTEKTNVDQLLLSANHSIFDLNAQVAGAVKLDVDHQAQCVDQIKVVKDEARKSKRRWFIIGYVAGFLSRQFLTKGL